MHEEQGLLQKGNSLDKWQNSQGTEKICVGRNWLAQQCTGDGWGCSPMGQGPGRWGGRPARARWTAVNGRRRDEGRAGPWRFSTLAPDRVNDGEALVLSGITDCIVLLGTNDLSGVPDSKLQANMSELMERGESIRTVVEF